MRNNNDIEVSLLIYSGFTANLSFFNLISWKRGNSYPRNSREKLMAL